MLTMISYFPCLLLGTGFWALWWNMVMNNTGSPTMNAKARRAALRHAPAVRVQTLESELAAAEAACHRRARLGDRFDHKDDGRRWVAQVRAAHLKAVERIQAKYTTPAPTGGTTGQEE
jgi:hypothetical protein